MAYQFKITLQDVEPPIWRRILVPKNIHFADFAEAILLSMQWYNICYFRFIINKSLYMPDFVFEEEELPVCYYNFIKDFIDCEMQLEYRFDDDTSEILNGTASSEYKSGEYVPPDCFGGAAGWMHTIEYEGEVEDFKGNISKCIDGARACPPEEVDFGLGYIEFLDWVKEKERPGREAYIREHSHPWRDYLDFDPEFFDVSKVKILKALELEKILERYGMS